MSFISNSSSGSSSASNVNALNSSGFFSLSIAEIVVFNAGLAIDIFLILSFEIPITSPTWKLVSPYKIPISPASILCASTTPPFSNLLIFFTFSAISLLGT